MAGGNFNPAPLRYGASNNTNLEAILNEIQQGVGSAFDIDRGSVNWAIYNALARVLNDLFEQNQRLANQWDPLRMTDFLERWEKILGIVPLPTQTLKDRRNNVLIKFRQFGRIPNQQEVEDLLKSILGTDVFISIETYTPNNANAHIPGGAVVPGGATIADGDWYSLISYLPIKVQQPDYMDDITFYNTVSQIFVYLDGFVPAWVTYAWFKNGPHGDGFYLDETNLDVEAFNP